MTDRLLKLAALWGVEIRVNRGGWMQPRSEEPLRPRLDIAHELLAKLPHGRAQVISKSNGEHIAIDPKASVSNVGYFSNFPDAVIALAERAGETDE